jgi:hypothetical protein
MSHGLEEIIGNRLAMGRIAKWAIELMGLDITYVPQTAIKFEALVDFCGGMDRDTTVTCPGGPGALEHVF